MARNSGDALGLVQVRHLSRSTPQLTRTTHPANLLHNPIMRTFLCSFMTVSAATAFVVPTSRRAFATLRMEQNSDLFDISGRQSSIGSAVEFLPPVESTPLDSLATDQASIALDTVAAAVVPTLNGLGMDTVSLVLGQENYGLAIVCVGEALFSFVQLPNLDNAKVLIPAGIASVVLVAVSGPMVTSGDPTSVGTGLFIATAVSVALGASYVARMLAAYSPAPKEAAFLGLLVAVAGFFTFSQNLVVDGFVTLPSLPTLPSIEFPSTQLPF